MTAKEVREKHKEYNENLGDDISTYEDIISYIKNHIKKDMDEKIYYYSPIPQRVKKKLQKDGFSINERNDRDCYLVEISWKETIFFAEK